MKADIKLLSETTKEKLMALDREEDLIYEAPDLIAAALVLPKRISRGTAEGKRSTIRKVEEAEMRLAMEYEISQGRNPQDMSQKFKGYDIVIEGETEKRHIEVKAFTKKRFHRNHRSRMACG